MRFLEPRSPLQPADAAVGLITDENGHYLVQLRDAKPDIFFPDHWGCFGGALEEGEDHQAALAREVLEETNLDVGACDVSYFTRYTFDFGFAGQPEIDRVYYEIKMRKQLKGQLVLREGAGMAFMEGEMLLRAQVVPYDRFAIWMHYYRAEMCG